MSFQMPLAPVVTWLQHTLIIPTLQQTRQEIPFKTGKKKNETKVWQIWVTERRSLTQSGSSRSRTGTQAVQLQGTDLHCRRLFPKPDTDKCCTLSLLYENLQSQSWFENTTVLIRGWEGSGGGGAGRMIWWTRAVCICGNTTLDSSNMYDQCIFTRKRHFGVCFLFA